VSRDRPPDLEPDYTYVADIANGGFANVYHYRDITLDRDVAVKVLKRRKERDFDDILNEARAMAKLQHPNIVAIYATLVSNDRQPCIIMMYCPGSASPDGSPRGRDLQELLAQGQLDLRKVVHLGVAICGAVQVAHENGIIHRDIKPSNILVDGSRPLLTDFGIAHMQAARANTPSGLSIPWSPREVLEGAEGNVASDIYSLGATLYHLIEGRSPFAPEPGARDTDEKWIDRICSGTLPPIQRPISSDLRNLIMGMLNREPDQRTRSAREAADRLARVEQDLGAPDDSAAWHVPGTLRTRAKPGQPFARTILRQPAQPAAPTVLRQPAHAGRATSSGTGGRTSSQMAAKLSESCGIRAGRAKNHTCRWAESSPQRFT